MEIKGLRILVTGGGGFIGSHIVESLVRQGAKVTVYDNFSSGYIENLSHIQDKIKIIKGDILNYNELLKSCKNTDIISHHAAQLEIIKCIENPVEDLRVNTEGTLNVFNAAVKCNVKKVIYASSACVYGQAEYVPEDENHPKNPNWPYGVSKYATEKYADIYHNYYDIEMIGLRYAIIYGPREWYGRVLTVFLKRALEGKAPVVWGGYQERDFTFVEDAVEFHNLCIQNDSIINEIFNVSTSIGTKISQLAEMVVNNFGIKQKPIYEEINEGEPSSLVEGRKRLPAELKQMILDNKKAKNYLSWEPKVDLEEGLKKEFEWLKDNKNRWMQMHY